MIKGILLIYFINEREVNLNLLNLNYRNSTYDLIDRLLISP
jgi:hypothetical protein